MKLARLALASALLVAPAWGQDPKPSAAVAVATTRAAYPSGSMAFVDARGSKSSWPLQFKVIGRPGEPVIETKDGLGIIYPALPDGIHYVAVSASAPVEGSPPAIDTAVVTVTVGQVVPVTPTPVVPPVTPVQPPAPLTPPAPAFTGPLHAVLIWDVKGDTPSTAAVRISNIAATLKGLGCDWWAYDAASDSAKAFAPMMAKDGIDAPVVYLMDATGHFKGDPIKAPTTPNDVVAKVKALRGAK